ncbi:DUF4145 domain-containing protein [Luteibacter sp. W1I16]|uniref:DUF4145 domain-containing protein n=1 Tax=Luteibacter sp. W1I16 TaxID=3373922 RepID=UPI003D1DF34C
MYSDLFLDRDSMVQCVHCRKHSIAVIRGQGNLIVTGSASNFFGDINIYKGQLNLVCIIPHIQPSTAPEGVPGPVAKAYVDGLDILNTGKWTPAAGAFRTSLDRATKILWADRFPSDDVPFKLDSRLKKLESLLGIPSAMMQWADSIRVVGNEMHEMEEISEADARDVAHFAEMFLTYAYTLPSRVEKFKERRAGGK